MTNDDMSKIMVTIPTKYYDALTRLKNAGIITSYASAVRDALIEWLENHSETFHTLIDDTVIATSVVLDIR